jgi:hypothetical protein
METKHEPGIRGMFEYIPFDDPTAEIRLIQIHQEPAATEYGEVVQCTLNNVPWEEDFPYCALSYTWGDLEDVRPVIVNDKVKFVTSNLADFLETCRKTLVEDDGVLSHPFWIDAISINQEDNKEKSIQVRQMGKLYQDAARVMVWLGSETDDSELAYKFLLALNESSDPVLERLNKIQSSGAAFVLDNELQGMSNIAH